MLTGLGEPIRVHATRLSPAVIAMLGVHAQIGRTFDTQEETPGKDAVVVLSHLAWQRYFGGTREILDRSLTLNGRRYSVIGVMPEHFEFPDLQTQLWIPYALGAAPANVPLIARLADGLPLEAASAQVSGILTRLRATAASRNRTRSTFELQRVQDQMVAAVRAALIALTVAVAVVLVIACLNIANLLLARSPTRRREIAVRFALGASRGRLVRQLLTENLVLAVAGGVVNVVFAVGGLQWLQALGRSLPRTDLTPGVSIPRLAEIAIDRPVFVFTTIVTAMSALLFGLAARRPAIDRRANRCPA
jgi:putative ABC transport system permease protein